MGEKMLTDFKETQSEMPDFSQPETNSEVNFDTKAEEDISPSADWFSDLESKDAHISEPSEEANSPSLENANHEGEGADQLNEETSFDSLNGNEDAFEGSVNSDGLAEVNMPETVEEVPSVTNLDDSNSLEILHADLDQSKQVDETDWHKNVDTDVDSVWPTEPSDYSIKQEEDTDSRTDALKQMTDTEGRAVYEESLEDLFGIPWFMINELRRSAEDARIFEEDKNNEVSGFLTENGEFLFPNREVDTSFQETHTNDDTVTFDDIHNILEGDVSDNTVDTETQSDFELSDGIDSNSNIEHINPADSNLESDDAFIPISGNTEHEIQNEVQNNSDDISMTSTDNSDQSGEEHILENNILDNYLETGNNDELGNFQMNDDSIRQTGEDMSSDNDMTGDSRNGFDSNQEIPQLNDDTKFGPVSRSDDLNFDVPATQDDKSQVIVENEPSIAQINDDHITDSQNIDVAVPAPLSADELTNDEPVT